MKVGLHQEKSLLYALKEVVAGKQKDEKGTEWYREEEQTEARAERLSRITNESIRKRGITWSVGNPKRC
jgi:hypothetical protein